MPSSPSPPPRKWIPWSLSLGALALALAQRPGTLIADTKLSLYVDPSRFLTQVGSVWSPTSDLGHVWGGQYGGYLFPMAPWFAAGHALGLPMWLVQRLWLGLLLALAAWAVVRLLDALLARPRGLAHGAAGVLYVVNPYVAVYADRTSVALLSYAALPWLMLCVHRGLRDPRGWWWAAAFALILTSAGGGVNAAVTGWILVGPLLLAIYEVGWCGVGRGALWPWAWRLALTNVVASAWWVVPLLATSKYGLNFLPYTEQPGTIWGTSSLSESLRLMGFWTSYIGVGFGGHLYPFAGHGEVLLFGLPVVLCGLLVPALSLAGFTWTRRERYGPFLLALTLVGLLVMSAGWPDGTPLRKGLTFTYNHVQAVQFLRTSYKAGPLTALGEACLGGMALAALLARLRLPRVRVLAAGAAAALVVIAAWPLSSGRAIEQQLAFSVPPAEHAVAAHLDTRPADTRALVLPGQLFAFYRWGGTIDAILPALTKHAVTTRYIVPFADLRSTDLQWAVDSAIGQDRLLPGQLPPLLNLLGVGDVVVQADGDRARSGEPPVADVTRTLAAQGIGAGARAYGPRVGAAPAAGRLDGVRSLPQISDAPQRGGSMVRVIPRGPLEVVDGAAEGVVDAAGFGQLHPGAPVVYAGDQSAAELRADAAAGGSFVITDSNRRQAFVASRLRGNRGFVMTPGENVSADGTMLDPFPSLGPAAQTVAVYRGLRSITSPFSPQVTQHPEDRPYAAMDGSLDTAWLSDRNLAPDRHYLVVDLGRARDVPYVDLYPYEDSRGIARSVTVNDKTFPLHRGWNRLPVRLHAVRRLGLVLGDVRKPVRGSAGGGGIRELRVPGVHVSEALRPPVLVERALRDADLAHASLSYLLDRFTVDGPYRAGRLRGTAESGLEQDAIDPEAQLHRVIDPPAARSYAVDAWVHADPRSSDASLDRLLGEQGSLVAQSSSRYEGVPARRASSALDGSRASAWIGQWLRGRPAWIAWSATRPLTLRGLRLVAPSAVVRFPTRVRLSVDGRSAGVFAIGRDGTLAGAPASITGRTFRLDILAARFPAGASGRERRRRAVGIAEITAAGLPSLRAPSTAVLQVPCGGAALRAGGSGVGLGGAVRRATLLAGRPVHLRGCSRVALPGAEVAVDGVGAPLVIDHLRLASPAATAPAVVPGGGRVLVAGTPHDASWTGVRLAVGGPSWLVLGESYDAGWRASCNGRDLGAPTPLQGYANGWRIDRTCTRASFSFAPQRAVDLGYIVSALGVLVLLALLVVRRRRPAQPAPPGATPDVGAAGVLPLRRAVPVAVAVTLVVGFLFSLRAGVVLGPLAAILLWRGASDRLLIRGAGVLLVVAVPVAYVLAKHDDRGGYNTYYAVDHRAAHWITVGAVVLLTLALGRALVQARRDSGGDSPTLSGSG